MKYMGSKRAMLRAGLGEIILHHLPGHSRFVDLFTGSGTVATHVAEAHQLQVVATDLQHFAVALAGATVCRDKPTVFENWAPAWIARALAKAEAAPEALASAKLQNALKLEKIEPQALHARELCSGSGSAFVRAYGGWYYSPWQALLLSHLRSEIEEEQDWAPVAKAALIQVASRCAAAPGHTAQPFKANTRAAPFLLEAWRRDVLAMVTEGSYAASGRHARIKGEAYVSDANLVADALSDGDLVFIDPPYSAVHYSRFYHVLESLARGYMGEVSGSGRYPGPTERPTSLYSIPTRAQGALSELMDKIAAAGCSAILTFPVAQTSNRLSGEQIIEIASSKFKINETYVTSKFSTLGGNRLHRSARVDTEELILSLKPA